MVTLLYLVLLQFKRNKYITALLKPISFVRVILKLPCYTVHDVRLVNDHDHAPMRGVPERVDMRWDSPNRGRLARCSPSD